MSYAQPVKGAYGKPTTSYLTVKDWMFFTWDQKQGKDVCSKISNQGCVVWTVQKSTHTHVVNWFSKIHKDNLQSTLFSINGARTIR